MTLYRLRNPEIVEEKIIEGKLNDGRKTRDREAVARNGKNKPNNVIQILERNPCQRMYEPIFIHLSHTIAVFLIYSFT